MIIRTTELPEQIPTKNRFHDLRCETCNNKECTYHPLYNKEYKELEEILDDMGVRHIMRWKGCATHSNVDYLRRKREA